MKENINKLNNKFVSNNLSRNFLSISRAVPCHLFWSCLLKWWRWIKEPRSWAGRWGREKAIHSDINDSYSVYSLSLRGKFSQRQISFWHASKAIKITQCRTLLRSVLLSNRMKRNRVGFLKKPFLKSIYRHHESFSFTSFRSWKCH